MKMSWKRLVLGGALTGLGLFAGAGRSAAQQPEYLPPVDPAKPVVGPAPASNTPTQTNPPIYLPSRVTSGAPAAGASPPRTFANIVTPPASGPPVSAPPVATPPPVSVQPP